MRDGITQPGTNLFDVLYIPHNQVNFKMWTKGKPPSYPLSYAKPVPRPDNMGRQHGGKCMHDYGAKMGRYLDGMAVMFAQDGAEGYGGGQA